jgi:ribonuclease H / adenosylcobalamin/alpha-ribazole phosphatase
MRAVLHFDGGGGLPVNGGYAPAAFAAILNFEGEENGSVVGGRLPSSGSHNVAEYNGLLAGLEHALNLGVRHLTVYGDSRLVIEQVAGRWKVKAGHLMELRARAQELAGRFERIKFEWVPRARNAEADRLVNVVLNGEELPAVAVAPAHPPGTITPPSRDARIVAISAALEELARQVSEIAQDDR